MGEEGSVRRLEVHLLPRQFYVAGSRVHRDGFHVLRQLLAEVFHHETHRVGRILAPRFDVEALAKEADHVAQLVRQHVRQPPIRPPLIEQYHQRLLVVLLVSPRIEDAPRHIIRTDRLVRVHRHLPQVLHALPVERPQFHLDHGPRRAQVVSCDCLHVKMIWSQRKDLRGFGTEMFRNKRELVVFGNVSAKYSAFD